jgi:transposase
MAKRYTDEFWRDAVRIATPSGLTRPQLSSDLGVLWAPSAVTNSMF